MNVASDHRQVVDYYDGYFGSLAKLFPDNCHLHYGLLTSAAPWQVVNFPRSSVRMLDALAELAQLERLAPGARGLDVGSGLGGTAMYLARRFGCRISGININAEQIADARRRVARASLDHLVSFVQADAGALPTADESVDLVTMIEVAFHIEDKAALFAEIYRVLRPGGRLLLIDQERVTALGDHLGIFHFAAFGFHERCCRALGFRSVARRDVSAQVAHWFKIAGVFARPAFQAALAVQARASGKAAVHAEYRRSLASLLDVMAREVRDRPGEFPNFPTTLDQASFLGYSSWELEHGRSRYQMWVLEK